MRKVYNNIQDVFSNFTGRELAVKFWCCATYEHIYSPGGYPIFPRAPN